MVSTTAVIEQVVEELVLSQENVPETYGAQRQIARHTGISVASVNVLIKNDLQLRCLKNDELTDATSKRVLTAAANCYGAIRLKWLTSYGLQMKNCSLS